MAETKPDKPPVDPLPPWAGIALSILALGFFAFHVAGRLPLDGTALIASGGGGGAALPAACLKAEAGGL